MKQISKLILLLIFSTTALNASSQKTVKQYIKKYESLAVDKMKQYSIPASVILGVSIVESAAGQSVLAKYLNNYFGIKGSNTDAGKKLGYKSGYKEYASDEASYEHFCQVLRKKRFYEGLKGNKDYKEWLKKMNQANYAEAKGKWVNKIMATIDKYKLYEFDEM